MANPTINWTPLTAWKIMQDSANDLTIASAVQGTKGTLYTDFDSIRTNCYNDYVDSSYGTKGVNPTDALKFRGYPKPTVTAAFTEDDDYGTVCGGNDGSNWVNCQVSIPNKVGFDIVVTVSNEDDEPSATDYNLTITAGNTSSSVLKTIATDDGKGSNRSYTMVVSVDIPSYTPILTGATGSIVFVAPTSRTNRVIDVHIGGSGCGCGGEGNFETAYYEGVGEVNGKILYTTTCGTTPVANNWWMYQTAGDSGDDYHFFRTISGVVSSYTACSWDGLPC